MASSTNELNSTTNLTFNQLRECQLELILKQAWARGKNEISKLLVSGPVFVVNWGGPTGQKINTPWAHTVRQVLAQRVSLSDCCLQWHYSKTRPTQSPSSKGSTYPSFWILIRMVLLCQSEVSFSNLALIMPDKQENYFMNTVMYEKNIYIIIENDIVRT